MENFMLTFVAIATLHVAMATQYEQPYYSHNNGGYYGDNEGGFMDWGNAGLRQQKCIDIPSNMSLCKEIGYNKMRLPNLLDHDTVREVTQQASSWVPLLGIRCHPDTKLFLCSLFSPVCLDRPIWPCRTLCEAVKNGCETLMLKYGFPWPEMLRCDKFPPDNDLCIGLQHVDDPASEPVPSVDDSLCTACSKPDTYEAIVDNFCSAEFVVRVSFDQEVVAGDDVKLVISNKKKKKLKAGSITKREYRNLLLYLNDGRNCDCPRLTQNAPGKQYLAMGARDSTTDKLVLNYVVEYDASNKDVKKAWKALKRKNLCQNGLPSLPITPSNGKKRGKKGGNKKKRKGDKDASKVAPSQDQPITGNNNNGGAPQTSTETGKKRRKNCKNPKKCTPATGAATGSVDTVRRQSRDRASRRKNKRSGRIRT